MNTNASAHIEPQTIEEICRRVSSHRAAKRKWIKKENCDVHALQYPEAADDIGLLLTEVDRLKAENLGLQRRISGLRDLADID